MSSRTWQLPEATHAWLLATCVDEHPALAALRARTATVDGATMQISPEQGQFMRWLVGALGVRRAVEVGTYTGYSALAVALSLPDDGQLVCCDVSEAWTAIGRAAWEAAGVADRIDLRIAPALDTLAALRADGGDGRFDLAFVDADKGNYPAYVRELHALLRVGGTLLVDNALWSGKVADPTVDDASTQAIRDTVAAVCDDPRWHAAMLPIGDGLLLARKLA